MNWLQEHTHRLAHAVSQGGLWGYQVAKSAAVASKESDWLFTALASLAVGLAVQQYGHWLRDRELARSEAAAERRRKQRLQDDADSRQAMKRVLLGRGMPDPDALKP